MREFFSFSFLLKTEQQWMMEKYQCSEWWVSGIKRYICEPKNIVYDHNFFTNLAKSSWSGRSLIEGIIAQNFFNFHFLLFSDEFS